MIAMTVQAPKTIDRGEVSHEQWERLAANVSSVPCQLCPLSTLTVQLELRVICVWVPWSVLGSR